LEAAVEVEVPLVPRSAELTLEGALRWLGSGMIGWSARYGEIAVWPCNGNPATTRPNATQMRILWSKPFTPFPTNNTHILTPLFCKEKNKRAQKKGCVAVK
jgi:hypothetical protein